ncbi:MAG: hypothetical protein JXC33_10620 [Deltaproteobacteria bacterium]|nr:hypothetical protein [Deltaproteobacteria bacterium]
MSGKEKSVVKTCRRQDHKKSAHEDYAIVDGESVEVVTYDMVKPFQSPGGLSIRPHSFFVASPAGKFERISNKFIGVSMGHKH